MKSALVDLVWSSEDSLLACSKSGFAVIEGVIPEAPESTQAMEDAVVEEKAESGPISTLEETSPERAETLETEITGVESSREISMETVRADTSTSEGANEKPQRRLSSQRGRFSSPIGC